MIETIVSLGGVVFISLLLNSQSEHIWSAYAGYGFLWRFVAFSGFHIAMLVVYIKAIAFAFEHYQ